MVNVAGYPLQTERLTVRIMRTADRATLLAYRNDPQVAALQSWELPHTAEHTTWLDAQDGLDDLAPTGWTQLAIEVAGQHIGDIAVHRDETGQQANLGFSLAKAHWGHGYATEAASAVIADLVERLGIVRLSADCDPGNTASQRVLERIGLIYSHDASKSFLWRGEWADTTYYAATAEQWRAWRDRPKTPPQEVHLVALDADRAREWRDVRTHHTQRSFVSPVEESYADAFFVARLNAALPPPPPDAKVIIPMIFGVIADGERGVERREGRERDGQDELLQRRHRGVVLRQGLVQARHGLGRETLRLLARRLVDEGHSELKLSYVDEPGGPGPFYRALGARPTGEVDDGEVVAILPLTALLA